MATTRAETAVTRAWTVRLLLPFLATLLVLTSCSGGDGDDDDPAPRPPRPSGPLTEECGDFTIAYDPSNGYEASAFIVGTIAEVQLDCNVEYVPARSREAWRLVAGGEADVYLDAYGNEDLREQWAGDGGPLTIVGRSGLSAAWTCWRRTSWASSACRPSVTSVTTSVGARSRRRSRQSMSSFPSPRPSSTTSGSTTSSVTSARWAPATA